MNDREESDEPRHNRPKIEPTIVPVWAARVCLIKGWDMNIALANEEVVGAIRVSMSNGLEFLI